MHVHLTNVMTRKACETSRVDTLSFWQVVENLLQTRRE